MVKKGLLIVVSGFSGVGKGTLIKELMRMHPNYVLSISATTRAPREGELDGREYFFKTREAFMTLVEEEGLLEYAEYVGNCYGTPRAFVEEQLSAGKNVLLEIEEQGALQIKKKFPEALLLYVVPPNAAELKKRLVGRGTEEESVITKRLKRAVEESDVIDAYDFIVVNDQVERAAKEIHLIAESASCAVSRNDVFIDALRREMHETFL